jgi:hypothetical protein
MSLYFSVSRDGFYNSEAGVPIPDDVIEITEDQYNHFLFTMNQENKMLVLEDGELVLKPRENKVSWEMIRQKRNKLLSQSDYTQMPDWPGNKTAWAEYRQALRNITQNFIDANEVVWPKAPNV